MRTTPTIALAALAALGGTLAYTSTTLAAPTVLDLTPGASDSFGGSVTILESFGTRTYLYGGVGGNRLYVTDGTLAGTRVLDDLSFLRNLSLLGAIDRGPLYILDDELYVHDGARTKLIALPVSSIPQLVGETTTKLAFVATTGGSTFKVYATDGTAASTRDLGDRDASTSTFPVILGARVYLVTRAGSLESTDGTTFTTALGGWAGAAANQKPVVCGGKLYIPTPSGLAITDGLATPTTLTTSLTLPASQLACGDTKLFFLGTTSASGSELWVSDGTVGGTRMVRDIRPGSTGITSSLRAAGAGRVVFLADDGSHGREPWTSDGTEAGTVLLADLSPGAGGSSFSFMSDTLIGGRAFFAHGSKFYATDGAKLLDRTSALGAVTLPSTMSSGSARLGAQLIFAGGTAATGRELVLLDPETLVGDAGPGDAGVDAPSSADAVASDATADSAIGDSAVDDSAITFPDDALDDASEDARIEPATSTSDDSCGCAVPGSSSSPATSGLFAAFSLALALLRRRR